MNKLKLFLHDPFDKCFDIAKHESRASEYASILGGGDISSYKGSDMIASCMERSLLPKDVKQEFNEIRHPFSNGKLEIRDSDKDWKREEIENILNELKDKQNFKNYDDNKKFLYLWRNLEDIIFFKEQNKKKWAKYISLLPADTRVPDHSIWEHLKITSALNASLEKVGGEEKLIQNNSLFIFSVGPVQSFISQARKAQDFYYGSYILSYFTWKAMEVIIESYGPTNIIYPDLKGQPLMDWYLKSKKIDVINFEEKNILMPTIPNRFVAFIPLSKKNEIDGLVKKIKENIDKEKQNIFDFISKVLEDRKISLSEDLKEKLKKKIESQFEDFPEIYWLSLPFRKENDKDISLSDFKDKDYYIDKQTYEKFENLWNFATNNGKYKPNIGLIYQVAYSVIERGFGGIKNIRKFKQYSVEEKGRKCSMCGERDVLFFNDDKPNKYANNTNVVNLTNNIEMSVLKKGEGLCAICFMKRIFGKYLSKYLSEEKEEKNKINVFEDYSFPSVSEIAISDFKNKNKELCYKYEEELRKIIGEIDDYSQFYYKENLRVDYIRKNYGREIDKNKIEKLKEELERITKSSKPYKYYAVIHLDGDNMGRWLSGDKLPGIENSYNENVYNDMDQKFKNDLKNITKNKILTPAIHSSISTALKNYALYFVREIVEKEGLGKVIYAGGDDVLAFVNLSNLLEVMQKLRFAFSGQVKIENGEIKIDLSNNSGFVEKDGRYILTMGPNATASMGVVIAHYKTPLQIVINKVFDAEKIAKNNSNKNSFCISFIRRSGEERSMVYKWENIDDGNKKSMIDMLINISKLFIENKEFGLSTSLIEKLKELKKLEVPSERGGQIGLNNEAMKCELSRIIKKSVYGKKEKIKENIENIINTLSDLFFLNAKNRVDNFINTLTILNFINGGIKE